MKKEEEKKKKKKKAKILTKPLIPKPIILDSPDDREQ